MAVLVVITANGMDGQRGPGAPRVAQAGRGMGQGLGAESKIQVSEGGMGPWLCENIWKSNIDNGYLLL